MSDDWESELQARLARWRADGLARELRPCAGHGVRLEIRGKPVLSFGGNDYLGLAAHEQVLSAARQALEASGAGAGASPLLCGYKPEHQRLEEQLAAFKQSEAARVFASGYQAAVALLSALAGAQDTVLVDRLAHASLLDGAALSGARCRAFKHNHPGDLAALLLREQPRRCLIAVESLYSMDGDSAPLKELVELAAASGALLLVDEAHATGVLGARGRGALESLSAGGLPRHVIAMGTLSKALGSQGGFICATKLICDTLLHAGRALMFSTALAPAAAAAAGAALRLIDAEPERRARVLGLADFLRRELRALQWEVLESAGPIVPLLAGDERRASAWSQALLERGGYAPAIRFPTVKKGQARLRLSLSAGHSEEDCRTLLAALCAIRAAE